MYSLEYWRNEYAEQGYKEIELWGATFIIPLGSLIPESYHRVRKIIKTSTGEIYVHQRMKKLHQSSKGIYLNLKGKRVYLA